MNTTDAPPIPADDPGPSGPLPPRQVALAAWDNEGGAVAQAKAPIRSSPANAELAQLHIRIIALENLLIAMLADASALQSQRIRTMAAFITPRPGFTQHHLTVQAAHQMVDLVQRADHFRSTAEE